MNGILDSVKDEPTVLKRLSDTIIKYANMNDKELQKQIKGIDTDLEKTEQKKQFIIDVYNEKDCSELVIISDNGRTIKSFEDPTFVIEDENLKEKIFSQLYFQEKGCIKDKFIDGVKDICNNIEEDNDLSFDQKTPLDRKKIFSAMKVTARENGYMVLNSLEECESGENIPLRGVEVKKEIHFQDLKEIYQKFEIDYKDKNWTELYVKDRETGNEITDLHIVKMAKFASIWVAAAGTKWMADEQLHGITYAFNEPSERIYNNFSELVEKCMTGNGMIDTQAIYEELSKDQYKHSEEIIRNLLLNQGNMSIVYDFYKMQINKARMETKLSETSNEFIYGYKAESYIEGEVDNILQSIPNIDLKDNRGLALEETIGKSQAQVEKEQKDKEANERTEQQVKKFKEETSNEANSKLSGQSLKKEILNSNITNDEINKEQQEFAERNEMRRLMVVGQDRTENQEKRYARLRQKYGNNQNQLSMQGKENRMGR